VVVPNHNIEQIEDLHMILEHSITSAVRAMLHTAAKRAA
jgi:D-sedoheptulose 7-phosphate isomerase